MKRILLLALLCLPSAVVADGFGFQTPSGNIFCNGYIGNGNGGEIYCSIVERSGELSLPRPSSCAGVWGHEYGVQGSGPAIMSCESTRPSRVEYSAFAPYGESAVFGTITCTSEKTGFTCTNRDGHGFFLSRRKQHVF